MSPEDWVAAFAEALGVEPPSAQEMEQLLALAGHAAHSSQRTAAPIACWVAGQSARPTSELLAIAREIG